MLVMDDARLPSVYGNGNGADDAPYAGQRKKDIVPP